MADRTVLYKLEMTGNLVPKSKELATNLRLVKKETDDTDKKVSNLRKVLAGLAGDMGSTGGRAVNLATGLGGAGLAGAAAAAAGGVVLLIGALIKNVHHFAEYAKTSAEAEKRIRGLGLVTEEQAAIVRDLGAAYKQSQQHLDAFKVSLAAGNSDQLKETLETSTKIQTAWEAVKFAVSGIFAAFVENHTLLGLLPGGGSSTAVTGPIKMTSGVKGTSDFGTYDQFPVRTEEKIGSGARTSSGPAKWEAYQAAIVDNMNHQIEIAEEMKAAALEANTILGGVIVDKLTAIQQAPAYSRAPGSQTLSAGIGIATGGLGAAAGALGGPVGMIASAVIELGPQLGNVIRDNIRDIFKLVTQLPDWIIDAVLGVVDTLEDLLPRLIAGIITLAPKLVIGIVQALPGIVMGIGRAILAIPGQIVAAIIDLPKALWEAIKSALGGLIKGKDGKFLGTSFKKGEFEILGFGDRKNEDHGQAIPAAASGGAVERDGMVYVHKGEQIVPTKLNRQGGGGINIHVAGSVIDTIGLVNEIRKVLGPYGRRGSNDPLPV